MRVQDRPSMVAVEPARPRSWGPTSWGAARPSRTAWAWFIALQAFNAADAALTHLAVERGLAVEANPVVRAIGVPGKLTLVAVGGVALLFLRPAALRVPVVVFGVVVAYTAAGIVWTSA